MKHILEFKEFLSNLTPQHLLTEGLSLDDLNKGKSIDDMTYFKKAVIRVKLSKTDPNASVLTNSNSDVKTLSVYADRLTDKRYYINRLGELLNDNGARLTTFNLKSSRGGGKIPKSNSTDGPMSSYSRTYADTALSNVPFSEVSINNKSYKVNILEIIANTFSDMFAKETDLSKPTPVLKNHAYIFLNPSKGFSRKNIVYREKERVLLFADNDATRFIVTRGNDRYEFIKNLFLSGVSLTDIRSKYRDEFENEQINDRTLSRLFGLDAYKYVKAFIGMYGEEVFNQLKSIYSLLDSNWEESLITYINQFSKLSDPDISKIYSYLDSNDNQKMLTFIKRKHSDEEFKQIENFYNSLKRDSDKKTKFINQEMIHKYAFDKEGLSKFKGKSETMLEAFRKMLEVDIDVMNTRLDASETSIQVLSLVPLDILIKDIDQLKSNNKLAAKYGVTAMSVKRRVDQEIKNGNLTMYQWDNLKL